MVWVRFLFVLVSSLCVSVCFSSSPPSPLSLGPRVSSFRDSSSGNFSSFVLDPSNYQLLLGGRDALYRLRLEDLSLLEKSSWSSVSPELCLDKGQSAEGCHNYVKLIHLHDSRIFVCGTNAFNPKCSWRSALRIQEVLDWVDGRGKCPYSPSSSVVSLLTPRGTYYIGSSIDFMSDQHAIFSMDGASNGFKDLLGSSISDYRWLSSPEFVHVFETDVYVYFLFREVAMEDYGKSVYSRIARICKNDQGESREYLSTFLKARLNCSSTVGEDPFYFNQLTSASYCEADRLLYGTFSTGENAIHGSAVCSFSMDEVDRAFDGDFLTQKSPDFVWKAVPGEHEHFKCQTHGSRTHTSREYQLVQGTVYPSSPEPLYYENNEYYSHIVVDSLRAKGSILHVLYVATRQGLIKKITYSPKTSRSCLIEVLQPLQEQTSSSVNNLVFMKESTSLYLTTDENIIRLDLNRCRFVKKKEDCLGLRDPYCGWDAVSQQCVLLSEDGGRSYPQAELSDTECPSPNERVDGKWSVWSPWEVCANKDPSLPYSDSKCLCRKRSCSNPSPLNGGSDCPGHQIEASNCSRNGQWTEWSDFGACSQSCDAGMKARRRYCSNPSPAHGGKPCIGRDVEHQYCNNLPPCDAKDVVESSSSSSSSKNVASPWSEWSSCSASCNGGFKKRTRSCFPLPCTDGCDSQYMPCASGSCPTTKMEARDMDMLKISDWTPWFRVNSSLGSSSSWTEKRYKFSLNVPSIHKDSAYMKEETRLCSPDGGDCKELSSGESSLEGGSSWFDWSPCNRECGGGQQIKIRSCHPQENDCQGVRLIERPCNLEACPPRFDCWSEWSLCGDNNIRRRTRVCPAGESCPPEDMVQEGPCLEHLQEVNCSAENSECSVGGIVLISLLSGFVFGLFCGGIAIFLFMKYKRSFIESIVSPKYVSAKSQNLYVSLPLWDIQNKQMSGLNSDSSKAAFEDSEDVVSLKNPRNSLTFPSHHSAPLDCLDPDKQQTPQHYS